MLATKVRGRMGKGANEVGLSRLHIMHAVEASLKRLGTDYIDLYQIHRFDALHEPRGHAARARRSRARRARSATSAARTYAAWQIMKALAISREQHLERFRCTQSYYSLAGRELEREIIPLIKDQNLGLLVWSPLAGGFLSGKFTRNSGDEAARRASFDFPPVNKEKAFDIIDVLKSIADARGVSACAGRACLAARAAGDDERDHRRAEDVATRRQPEVG